MKNVYSSSKVLRFPDRITALAAGRHAAPVHVRIKPTNACNHSCYFCAYRSDNAPPGEDMNKRDKIPRAKMAEIVDDLVAMNVRAVTFSGGGEPLIYPYLAETVVRLAEGGATLACGYERPLTWVTATLGAGLFTALMIIVFGVIPNQMLTLAQGPLEWTSARTLLTIPPVLVLGTELTKPYETCKDMVVGGYAFTTLIVVAAAMVLWQNYDKKKDQPKPQRISEYGRPIRVED